MGVFGAMLTAVSGLRSQSYALENISGNIANSQTTGFKRVDTAFSDLIPDMPRGREVAGSVAAYARATNSTPGDRQNSSVGTHLALNGEGFFTVAQRSGYTNGLPSFNGQQFYTRRGDFEVDRDGYLVNGSGYYLVGRAFDPLTGAPSATTGPIQLPTTAIPAKRTATITYSGNLPRGATAMNGAIFPPATTSISAANESAFLSQSIAGGTTTVYTAAGDAVSLEVRWGKFSDGTWGMFYRSNNPPDVWTKAGSNVSFNADGSPAGAVGPFNLSPLVANGQTIGNVTINFPTGKFTQYANASGLAEVDLKADGYTAGKLNGITISSDGRVNGSYSNGQVLPLSQIQIAQFNADNSLQRLNGGIFAETFESGAPIYGLGSSSVASGALEASNVDIAEEFSKMIVTQQAYSANTRVVTTAQQMLSDVINIVR
ncbi:flagellar hook protein FlgE [Chelatococcus sp. SYSU_G07232]|uniref:Flagellar hook protein FlgE n=1 Tax=Chelatococcus albus TaxID=3047466 RepID=A0ABT7AHA9_9HYPH|nr:flagellar hook protein FlgE [Chelatococcus sp. SYSU_G07232]MDJ1158470.1 flagellar hook protein FlgE [Chelatococcus sp. SYSU_G07232]